MVTEELFHASGVIAVVVAGIFHSLVKEKTETVMAEESVLTENIWSLVIFVLNGVVFLLLGLNIPSSTIETVANPEIGNWLAIGYVLAIGFIILAIRFIWTYLYNFYEVYKGKTTTKPNLRTTLMISLTGVRGAVTMAGVLSIPYFVMGGKVFPERSLILFLAAGVILFTLIAATVLLPLLSRDETGKGEDKHFIGLNEAKRKVLLAAIKTVNAETNESNQAVAYELIDEIKLMFRQVLPEQKRSRQAAIQHQQKITDIRLMALKAERKYLQAAVEHNEIDAAVFETFERSLEYREEALSNSGRSKVFFILGTALRSWRGYHHKERPSRAQIRVARDIQLKALEKALTQLEKYLAEHEQHASCVYPVISDYKRMMDRLKMAPAAFNEKQEEQKEELRLKVMDAERSKIHEMFKLGEITREQARELRRYINYVESAALFEPAE